MPTKTLVPFVAKTPTTSGESTLDESKTKDLGQVINTRITAFLTEETSRRNDEWRHTLQSFRAALTALDRTCEAAARLPETPEVSASAVSDLVENCVTQAAAEREAAVRKA